MIRLRWIALAVVAAAAFFGGGWLLRLRNHRAGPGAGTPTATSEATGRLFTGVFQTIRSHAVDSLDDQAIYRLATTGVLAELGDPYAALLPGNDSGPVERLGEPPVQGIYLDQPEGYVEVVAVVPGSAAEEAGLRAGDAILAVDATATGERRADQVRRLIEGPEGSTVRIRVGRDIGEDAPRSGPLWVTFERGPAPALPPPRASGLGEGLTLIQLGAIDGVAVGFVRRVVDSLGASGRGVVLDLRGVVEGQLADAVALAGVFVGAGGAIVTARGRPGRDSVVFRDRTGELTPELPVVILVDRGTAGAAEVVAGALQDHDRGLVIGEVTFGRGAGQSLFPLGNGSTLRLTTTVWVTPSGRVIQRLAPPPLPLAEEDADTAAGRPKFRTEAGRTVLGGGGIVPDREVSVDPEEPSRSADPSLALARELLARAKTRKALLATPDHS